MHTIDKKIELPKLDNRTGDDIYQLLLKYVDEYANTNQFPELTSWIKNWDIEDNPQYFNSNDTGLVLYKIFSQMMEDIFNQFNHIPEKYQIVFYDLLGLELKSARSAITPLTFTLAKGAKEGYVPVGTMVTSKKHPDVIFETTRDLYIYPSYISRMISYNPWIDRFEVQPEINPSENTIDEAGISIFADGPEAQRMPHSMHFSFGQILDIQSKTDVTIKFTYNGDYGDINDNYPQRFFSKWLGSEIELIPVTKVNSINPVNTTPTPNVYTSTFILNISKNTESKINNVKDFWLTCEPQDDSDPDYKIINDKDNFPVISNIQLSIDKTNIFPENIFANRAPVDIKKGFFPFEEVPKVQNAFYLNSTEVFSRKKAAVDVTISAIPGMSDSATSPTLLWQYWNGIIWVNLSVSTSPKFIANSITDQYAKSVVSFTCPNDIALGEIEGKPGWWIRLVLSKGGYQKEEYKVDEATNLNIPESKHTVYYPPFIGDIKLSYKYTNVPPQKITLQNYYNFVQHDPLQPTFNSYEITESEKPSFYIGLEDIVPQNPITLLSIAKIKIFGETIKNIKDPFADNASATAGKFIWQYYNGQQWTELKSIEDGSAHLINEGLLSFTVPQDWQKTEVCQINKHWLRLQTTEGNDYEPYHILGLFANAVNSESGITVVNEIIGSGNGKPDLTFQLHRYPILTGQKLEIFEGNRPSRIEEEAIIKEEGDDAIRIETDGETGEQMIWVRWHPVKNFRQSGPRSRHYIIDRATGSILFGDGQRGCLPPVPPMTTPGGKNIVMRYYKTAGMRTSNLERGEINSLKRATPGVDKVVNWSKATGGEDPEYNKDLLVRGPHTIKNRNRAVTREDLEWLAKESDSTVARACCHCFLLTTDTPVDKIQIVIIPDSTDYTPVPSTGLIRTVENYINSRAPVEMSNTIEVVGPKYSIIEIELTYKPTDPLTAPGVSIALKDKIIEYFHPLTGKDGQGWGFADKVRSSELGSALEDVAGVDYLESLQINVKGSAPVSGISEIETGKNELPTAQARQDIIVNTI